MNIFITSTTLLGISILSSCSTIKGFRGDPDTWGKKGKKEKTKKVAETPKLAKQKQKQRPVTRVRSHQGIPTSSANNVSKVVNSNARKGRTVKGMIEPKNITKLPDNKDLQESNNVAPAPMPVAPKLETPVKPLLPIAPEAGSGITDPADVLPPVE